MRERHFDKLFDEAFDAAAKKATVVPDAEPSWERMQKKIGSKNKRRKLLGSLPVAVASFLLGAFLFGSPALTSALNPLFDTVKHYQQNVVSFVFGTRSTDAGALTPPPDESAGIEENNLSELPIYEKSYSSWEEAARHFAFSTLKIHDIPPDYRLSEVRLYSADADSPANEARLVYYNHDNQRLIIKLSKLGAHTTITSSHAQDGGTYEVIELDHFTAYYFAVNNGLGMLEFIHSGLHISLSGPLTKETFIQLAESIK
ncbi:DUF4367 domain-containing protein [Cohnella terricola]|uniref:DUF4367 domain-containing protein n=1 Tax=Cohnella terricola TaxID=1289167 RepID=A0A559JBB6_9BACL|nr:DUF4367 domain-containing protein [Cohnella terricola]TVX97151.1 DUF4367 domain-containing protein [Cohnella terricola]